MVEALSKGDAPDEVHEKFGMRQENRNGTRPGLADRQSTFGAPLTRMDTLTPVPTMGLPGSKRPGVDRVKTKSPAYEFELPTGSSAELGDPLNNLNLGYLSIQEGGRTRYIGSTFWAYMSDELDQLNTLLRDQNRYHSATSIGNRECEGASLQKTDSNTSSTESNESNHAYGFHKFADPDHREKLELREDCPGCQHTSFDKSILLHASDAHPNRFAQLDRDMLSGIPSETQSHILFRCWLSGVHSMLPLLHPPIVLKKYEEFWRWRNASDKLQEAPPNPAYITMLYAIWYAGSVSISLDGLKRWFPNTNRAKLSAKFHDHITRCLTLINFPRNPSIPSLAAFLMLQTILVREEEPVMSSLFVGLALRVAQTMGLHRDPELFDFEPWEVQTRRRLWWYIMLLDNQIAISSGLPPLINTRYSDVRMIGELKDQYIGTEEGKKYEEDVSSGKRKRDNPDEPMARTRPSMVQIWYVFFRAKNLVSDATRQLLELQLKTAPLTRHDMDQIRKLLADLEQNINKQIERIPTKGIPEYGFEPQRLMSNNAKITDVDMSLAKPPSAEDLGPFMDITPTAGLNEVSIQYHWNTMAALHKWARIVLSMLIDKTYCVSYQPFLKNAKSKLWAPARQCIMRHCHAFMRKFISLATDPAFQPFHWSWPGNHQPMHPTMITLVDLYERPHSVEAPRSRAFIDKIFSMASPDGGIVSGENGVSVQRPLREGGREAWEMLRKLRERAWQKAGLDPDILWTEEEQIKAGVAQPLTKEERVAQALREDTIPGDPSDFSAPIKQPKTSPSTSYHPNLESAILKGIVNSAKKATPEELINAQINSQKTTPTSTRQNTATSPRPQQIAGQPLPDPVLPHQQLSAVAQNMHNPTFAQQAQPQSQPQSHQAPPIITTQVQRPLLRTIHSAAAGPGPVPLFPGTYNQVPSGVGELPTFSYANPVPAFTQANPYFNPPTAESGFSSLGSAGAASGVTGNTPSDRAVPDAGSGTYSLDPSPAMGNNLLPSYGQGQGQNRNQNSNSSSRSGTAHGRGQGQGQGIGQQALQQQQQMQSMQQDHPHFDWDQWDAVFGQHVPIDDGMDFKGWNVDEYANGDTNMDG